MGKITKQYKKQCECKKCNTWAEMAHYQCGCVTVTIHNDKSPCRECTNFTAMKRYCGKSSHPENHNS